MFLSDYGGIIMEISLILWGRSIYKEKGSKERRSK